MRPRADRAPPPETAPSARTWATVELPVAIAAPQELRLLSVVVVGRHRGSRPEPRRRSRGVRPACSRRQTERPAPIAPSAVPAPGRRTSFVVARRCGRGRDRMWPLRCDGASSGVLPCARRPLAPPSRTPRPRAHDRRQQTRATHLPRLEPHPQRIRHLAPLPSRHDGYVDVRQRRCGLSPGHRGGPSADPTARTVIARKPNRCSIAVDDRRAREVRRNRESIWQPRRRVLGRSPSTRAMVAPRDTVRQHQRCLRQ